MGLVQMGGKNAKSHALLGKKKDNHKNHLSPQLASIKHVAFEIRRLGQNPAFFHHLCVFTFRKSLCLNVSLVHSDNSNVTDLLLDFCRL